MRRRGDIRSVSLTDEAKMKLSNGAEVTRRDLIAAIKDSKLADFLAKDSLTGIRFDGLSIGDDSCDNIPQIICEDACMDTCGHCTGCINVACDDQPCKYIGVVCDDCRVGNDGKIPVDARDLKKAFDSGFIKLSDFSAKDVKDIKDIRRGGDRFRR